MLNNTITSQVVNNNVVVVTSENQINVTQPITNVIEVATPGPQGPQGPQGPSGSIMDSGSFATTGSNIFIGNQTITGSVDITGSLTVNTVNVGQNTLNFIDSNNTILTSLSVSGSNLVLSTGSFLSTQGGFTGSLLGTASWAGNVISSSYALTASYAINAVTPIDTSSFVQNSQTSSMLAPYVLNSSTSSFVTNSQTSSFVTTSSFNTFTSSINGITSSFLTTGSSNTTQIISGSLIINQNLTVLGSSSIVYITSSQLNVGNNLITVNTSTPAIRFGGLAVFDSGSTGTGKTGSILWDSQNDVWVYSNPSGAAYDGAMILVGPRNLTGLGNEVGINSGYAAVGDGSHHMTSSAIYSSGSLIRLENNTQITGSLNISSGITGSFTGSLTGQLIGTSSWANNTITASYIQNAQTASYVLQAVSASYSTLAQTANTASYIITAQTASYVLQAVSSSFASTASYIQNAQTASYVLQAVSSSFATTASYVTGSVHTSTNPALSSSYALSASYAANAGAAFPYNGTAVITGSLITSGSTTTHINDVVITGSLIVSSSGTNISNIIGGSTSGSRIAFKATNITGVPTSVSNMFSFFSNNTTELLRIGDSLNGQVDTAIWGAGNGASNNYAIRFGSTYCYVNGSSDTRIMVNGTSNIQCVASQINLLQSISVTDAKNFTFSGTTGTKIGTATTEKLAFWNKTPIVQPTTAIAAATFVANSGTAVNDASTFGGYTLKQIVQALQNIGLLA